MEFCIEWKPHQAWFKVNNINYELCEDELKYRVFQDEYKFSEELKKKKLMNAVNEAVLQKAQ